jgi:hypothetical protein
MTANGLIDLTLKEIARDYQPGTLPWMKVNSPEEWRRMLILEQRINGMALEGNLDSLRGALEEYQGLILGIVKEFRSLKEKKGHEMFNFVESHAQTGER